MITRVFNNVEVNFKFRNQKFLKYKNVIYLLRFPNSKVYIGQTTVNLVNRIKQHCHDNDYNHKANCIRKYKTFDVTILKHCNINELDNYEIYFISLYSNSCVNHESGGHANKILSEETKEKIRNTLLSKNYNVGKKVLQYDGDGNFLNIFDSTKHAAKELNLDYKLIWKSCTKYKKYKNYIFIYIDDVLDLSKYNRIEIIKPIKLNTQEHTKAVNQYDLNGKYLKTYTSINEAARETKCSPSNIRRNCQLETKTANNYQWRYYTGGFSDIDAVTSKYIRCSEKMSFAVCQYSKDGTTLIHIWNNAREAGNYLKINEKNIQQCCVGKRKSCGGFKWIYKKNEQ